jgi:hypothetical protein
MPNVSDCYTGYYYNADGNSTFKHCWESFAQFISLAWAPYDDSEGWTSTTPMNDLGPIIWPSKGYRQIWNSDKLVAHHNGFYEPKLFQDGAYLYVTFKNGNDLDMATGQQAACISIARAPVNSQGVPGSWNNLYKGKFETPSLPPGFTKENIAAFYNSTFETRADCVFKDSISQISESINFNIAKLEGTDLFIGAEERVYNGGATRQWQMGIRISRDLINWSPLQVLSTGDCVWGCGEYAYPTFLNAQGDSNYKIDHRDFYILGKHAMVTEGGFELKAMRLGLDIEGYAEPLTRAERLVLQYYREFLGWKMPVSDSGVQWHVAHLEANGCEADVMKFVTSQVFAPSKANLSNTEYVNVLYRAIISRPADGLSNGSQWWVAQLASGALTRDSIVANMYQGWEAKQVCNTGKLISASAASSFDDVPATHPFSQEIETLYQAGFTAGCQSEPLKFCPDEPMQRARAAVFVVRAMHGAAFNPEAPAATVISDVPLQAWEAGWTHQLYIDGFTAGCSAEPLRFCSSSVHARAEAAVMGLRIKLGESYSPPPASGIFEDLHPDWWGSKWGEAAYLEGLIPPCSEDPLLFCPDGLATRALAAYMIVQAKLLN